MCARTTHLPPLFFRISLVIFFVLVGFAINVSATEEESPCVIYAKPEEKYDLELTKISNNEEDNTEEKHTITFNFDTERDISDRLTIEGDFVTTYDWWFAKYYIKYDSVTLCNVKYLGLEKVLLDDRAKLEFRSTEYRIRLLGVHVEEENFEHSIPDSFFIIIPLCSLIPFFLLMPDAIEQLQEQMEVEAASRGVYGRVLSLLLPLLSIALTFFLLQTLNIDIFG
jgi:hypothetical protein